jgi:hypothetical protein
MVMCLDLTGHQKVVIVYILIHFEVELFEKKVIHHPWILVVSFWVVQVHLDLNCVHCEIQLLKKLRYC